MNVSTEVFSVIFLFIFLFVLSFCSIMLELQLFLFRLALFANLKLLYHTLIVSSSGMFSPLNRAFRRATGTSLEVLMPEFRRIFAGI